MSKHPAQALPFGYHMFMSMCFDKTSSLRQRVVEFNGEHRYCFCGRHDLPDHESFKQECRPLLRTLSCTGAAELLSLIYPTPTQARKKQETA